jgi:hypothetical protein
MKFHVKEIMAVPRKDFSYNVISNGKLFQSGSLAFLFLNVFNSVIRKEPVFASDNLPRLGAAGGVYLLGTILAKSSRTYWEVGKQYQFKTIKLGVNSSPRISEQ